MTAGDDQRFDWRRGGAAAIALVATLILLGMVVLVAMTNTARDDALDAERHAYDVALLTRTMDASIARADAAIGRYALDENVSTSGSRYYGQWRLAGQQLGQLERSVWQDPDQRARVKQLRQLFNERGQQFTDVALYIASRQKNYGVNYYYTISLPSKDGEPDTGTKLRAKLGEIPDVDIQTIRGRGYRLVARPVEHVGTDVSDADAAS